MIPAGLIGLLAATPGQPRLSIERHRVLNPSPEEHEGFPRLVRAADGRLLLFTRLGTTL